MLENKRGQVYLLASIIIISLILGFVTVTNVFKSDSSSTRIYDLKEELNIEGGEVLDYSVYNAGSSDNLIQDFTSTYASYAGEGRDLVFVIGNKERIVVYTYERISEGKICIQFGDNDCSGVDIPGANAAAEVIEPTKRETR